MPIPMLPPAPPRQYVKCPSCGWVYFVLSREEAQRSIDASNAYNASIREPSTKSITELECCFACQLPAVDLVSIDASEVPPGATLQGVVIEP